MKKTISTLNASAGDFATVAREMRDGARLRVDRDGYREAVATAELAAVPGSGKLRVHSALFDAAISRLEEGDMSRAQAFAHAVPRMPALHQDWLDWATWRAYAREGFRRTRMDPDEITA